jgi:hypothetical protein
MSNVTAPRIDYTNKDYQSLVDGMLALARERLPEWTDHSPNDLGIAVAEMVGYLGDVLCYYTDRALNESFLDTAAERSSVVNLLRLIGYELRPPTSASADLTLYFDLTPTGIVTIPLGMTFETQIRVDDQPVRFRYNRPDLSIDTATLPTGSLDGKSYLIYQTLPVVQVDQAVPQETVGSSDGSAAQRFRLAHRPLMLDTLVLRVDEGAGSVVWSRRETLLDSSATDQHYTVRRDADEYAWIAFGDGKHGRVPRRGLNNITAEYLVGGGAKGNVAPQTITKIVTPVGTLKKASNLGPATGGDDAEPADEAAVLAPRQFRSMDRAVTTQDYESHALRLGVGKARARAANWNRIELFVAPAGGGYPTETLKQDLLRYFDTKRMLSSIVEVLDPVYVSTYVEGTLEVEPYVFRQQIQQQVESAIQAHLSFDRRAFQDTLYLSKIYEAIEQIPGVFAVNVTRFARTDSTVPLPPNGKLEFGWNEIPVAGQPSGILLTQVTGGRGA